MPNATPDETRLSCPISAPAVVSVVIAACNEAETIRALVESVGRQSDRLNQAQLEIIVVDDGSTDGTRAELERMAERGSPPVRIIRFEHNRGKTAALAAAFGAAKGGVVITLDGDFQDDPTEIPFLLAKLNDGFDLVVGWRRVRRDPLSKRLASWLFNRGTALVSGLPLHDINCGCKAMRLEVAKALLLRGETHRFIPLLADRMGFRVTEAPVLHHGRKYGVSKYGPGRCLPAVLDLCRVMLSPDKRRRGS